MATFMDRLKHGWNAFTDPTANQPQKIVYSAYGSSYRPDQKRFSLGNERSIINSIYNRIAMDVASVKIEHARLDDNERYLETISSGLNNCLTLEANIDQTGRALIQDIVMSLFDEGCVAVVPIDTSLNPNLSDSYDIKTMRTGKILEWFPDAIRVRIYNDRTGKKEDLIVKKRTVAIIENPLYSVMNEPNSTLKRLIRKLNLLDNIDEQSGSGRLDMVVQLPYAVKSAARKEEAKERLKDVEAQLNNSKYGIAYIDATEHITQLNRPVENSLMKEVEYLTSMLYSQLGITNAVLDGTADEKTMLNYHNRTVEPILSAIVDEMKRKFLTKTARSQKQSIIFVQDPFKLVPIDHIADIADKFTRNEIMSSNEIRGIVGMRPSQDPKADELRNKNLNQSTEDQNGAEIKEKVMEQQKQLDNKKRLTV